MRNELPLDRRRHLLQADSRKRSRARTAWLLAATLLLAARGVPAAQAPTEAAAHRAARLG